MSDRYNFHDELKKVKQNPKYVLPQDINESEKEFFRKKGCELGTEIIEEFEKHVRYGHVDIFHKKVDGKKISMQIDSGMVDGHTTHEIREKGDYTAVITYSVRNKKLDKKKLKRAVRNES